jgi:hypothetical protein
LAFQFNIPGDRTAAYGRQDPVEKKMFGKMLKERGFGDAIMRIAGVKQCVRLGLAVIDDRYEEREGEREGQVPSWLLYNETGLVRVKKRLTRPLGMASKV